MNSHMSGTGEKFMNMGCGLRECFLGMCLNVISQ